MGVAIGVTLSGVSDSGRGATELEDYLQRMRDRGSAMDQDTSSLTICFTRRVTLPSMRFTAPALSSRKIEGGDLRLVG